MDDIHLEDPRKFSAKQIKMEIEQTVGKRTIWQYFWDLTVKTLVCIVLIALDFTLFATAGNYSLFNSASQLTLEAQYIYAAIAIICFLVMLAASFKPRVENAVMSLCVALTVIALINQFATFEKHSGLLIIFNGIFSDSVNATLYEYSFGIIGVAVFALSWMFFNALRRSFVAYILLGLGAVFAWMLSEAYFNTSSQYFREVASAPTLREENLGKRFIFLSFNEFTSPNNLKKMADQAKQNVEEQKSFSNLLGMLDKNNFVLYPNALATNPYDQFLNLVAVYNFDGEGKEAEYVMNSAIRNEYFDFRGIQKDKLYIRENALYKKLQKDDYKINVYQTREIDTCYVNNKLAAANCREKVNVPIALNEPLFTQWNKTLLLTAQWFNSTGFVKSLNPLLKMLEYVVPGDAAKPLGVQVDTLYVVNSFKVFDLMIENIEHQTGNQAYFAIIDLPSDTYVYDEFCQIKGVDEWKSETNPEFVKNSIDDRRKAYADQVNCAVGSLAYFLQRLDEIGQLEKSTVIVQGLGNPHELIKNESEYYPKIQAQGQVLLAIKPEGVSEPQIDYSVCRVDEILNSYLVTNKPCEEFSEVKTTEKNMEQVRAQIENDKYKDHQIETARNNFGEWMRAWLAYNQDESNFRAKAVGEPEIDDSTLQIVEEVAVMDTIVADVPEEKMPSISQAQQEKDNDSSTNNGNSEVLKTEKVSSDGTAPKAAEPPAEKVSPNMKSEDNMEEKTKAVDEDIEDAEKVADDRAKETETIDVAQPKVEVIQTETEVVTQTVAETAIDVVPDTVFDTPEEHNSAENAIAKAKKAMEAKRLRNANAEKTPEEKLDNLAKDVESTLKDEKLKNVLEAPKEGGQNLSPEELKQKFRSQLEQNAPQAKSDVNLEVKVVEN